MDKQATKEICLKHGQQIVNLTKATALSDALHLIQSGIRYDSEKDLEHGLELLRSTRDELCAIPNYHADVELVGTAGSVGNDPINPNHYKTDSGVQAIDIAELFPYSLGNAIKYAWRAGKKDNLKQDLEKCEWYLNRARLNGEDSLFMCNHSSVLRARRLFAKLNKTDLPELNYELVSRILDGRLEYALTHIDDCFVGER